MRRLRIEQFLFGLYLRLRQRQAVQRLGQAESAQRALCLALLFTFDQRPV